MESRTRRLLGALGVLVLAAGGLVVYSLLAPTEDGGAKANAGAKTAAFGTPGAPGASHSGRSRSGGSAEDEPSDEVKAWLAKLEAAIRDGDRHRVEVLVWEGRESLGYALPLVRKLLGECETPQRVLCVFVLSRMSDAESLALLRSLLVKTEPAEMKIAVIEALVERRDVDSGEAVLAFFVDASEAKEVRLAAIKALETIGKPEFADAILKVFLADTDQQIRIAALNAIGKLAHGNDAVSKKLVEAWGTETMKKGLRLQLVRVLGEIGSEAALDLLNEIATRGDDMGLRVEAVMALRMVATEKAQDALVDLAKNTDDERIRYEAIHNIACLPGDKAKDVLTTMLDRQWEHRDVRDLCAQGLLAQRDPECAKKLVDVMHRDPDMSPDYFKVMNKRQDVSPDYVRNLGEGAGELSAGQRKGLVDAFRDLSGDAVPAACDQLRRILDTEQDADVQKGAMYALANHHDATALPLLRRYYETSDDVEVRDAALESAGHMDGPEVEAFLQGVIQREENYGLKMAAQGALNEVLKRK
jgi:HEAT repeat protein